MNKQPDRQSHGGGRYAVSVPIVTDRGKGITCEMSLTEIAFEIDSSFAAGEEITMTLSFWGPLAVKAECSGRVLRATPAGQKWRVEATIERFTLAPPSSS
ncbi:MAG TPA: hypothetical protein VL284_08300 [Thermoanaerobaculia bacterium]|nr:hypothetical protein [Thermoanaerobaculia bacterium]